VNPRYVLSALFVGMAFCQSPRDSPLHSLTALLDGSGFVRVPAGEFTMGSAAGNADEQPAHRVRISQAFEMGKFEVTQAQWIGVMRDPHAKPENKGAPDDFNPSHFKGLSRPVESASWDAVQQFISALNSRDPKHVYRLPTEAEWEYAARGGVAGESKDLDRVAWHEPNSGGETQPVGRKSPNAWGLYDIVGNVLEWVQDWYGLDFYATSPGTDPRGPGMGSYKVYRGCGWLSAPQYCRPAFRGFDFPNTGYYSVGFRLVRTRKERVASGCCLTPRCLLWFTPPELPYVPSTCCRS